MEINAPTGKSVAAALLDIQAIKLNLEQPFTWASGWKSPIYCDNRLSLSYPQIRTMIREELSKVIQKNFPETDVIAGVATAGIPQGVLVADSLELPFVYVRSKPKGHGMENMIEGKVVAGQKVVLVEDLVSTGGSSLKAAAALKDAGVEVLGMVAIFTYGFDVAKSNFTEAGVPLICLSSYNYLLEEALQRDYIKEDQLKSLHTWRSDPGSWNG